jgi:hypothetical protein
MYSSVRPTAFGGAGGMMLLYESRMKNTVQLNGNERRPEEMHSMNDIEECIDIMLTVLISR